MRVKQVGPKQAPQMPLNPMEALQIPADEMVHLPPPPDRSYKVYWPIQETFSMDTSSFQVIYPSYLDSTKTIKQGRRLPKEKAIETPTVSDVSQALQLMQVRHVIFPYKGYPRDASSLWDNPGRVLVDVSNKKKSELMLDIVERMSQLPERTARLERQEEERAKYEAEKQAAIEQANKAIGNTGTKKPIGNSKKKGKKGKRK